MEIVLRLEAGLGCVVAVGRVVAGLGWVVAVETFGWTNWPEAPEDFTGLTICCWAAAAAGATGTAALVLEPPVAGCVVGCVAPGFGLRSDIFGGICLGVTGEIFTRPGATGASISAPRLMTFEPVEDVVGGVAASADAGPAGTKCR
jgi:hypothetical protein